jgi:hypothetical protein
MAQPAESRVDLNCALVSPEQPAYLGPGETLIDRRRTWASAREITAPNRPSEPSDNLGYSAAQNSLASGSRVMQSARRAKPTARLSFSRSSRVFCAASVPPSGNDLDLATSTHRNRLAKPFVFSVSLCREV